MLSLRQRKNRFIYISGTSIYIAALLVIICATFLFYKNFGRHVRADRIADDNARLSEIAKMSADYIKDRVDVHMHFVKAAAKQIEAVGGPRNPDAIRLLRNIVGGTDFEYMAITFLSGISITTSGHIINFNDSGTYPDGKIIATTLTGTDFLQRGYLVFVVPVMIGGEIAAHVRGIVSANSVESLLDNDIFRGEGYIQLFRADGSYIFRPKHQNMLDTSNNVLDYIQSIELDKGVSLESVVNSFNSRRDVSFRYSYEKQSRFAYFTPIGIEDWFLGVLIPGELVESRTEAVRRNTILLMLQMSVIFSILIIYIIYRERRSSRYIYHANQLTEALIANIPGGVQKCRMDEDFTYDYVSVGFAEMAGCSTVEEAVETYGGSFWNSILAEDRETARSAILAQLGEKDSFEAVYRMPKKDGSIIYVLCKGGKVLEENGYYCAYGVTADITQTQRAVEELRISEERYKIAIAQSDILIFEYDPATDSFYNAENAAEVLGVPSSVSSLSEYLVKLRNEGNKEASDAIEHMLGLIRSGKKDASARYYHIIRDGRALYVETHLSGVYGDDGKLLKIIGVVEDLTEQKETEIKYLQAEKFRSTLSALYDRTYEIDVTNNRLISGVGIAEEYSKLTLCEEFDKTAMLFSLHSVLPEDREKYERCVSSKNIREHFDNGVTEFDFDFRSIDANGWLRWNIGHISIFIDPSDSTLHAHLFVKDVTDSVTQTELLRSKAEKDSLTGLYNKTRTEELISEDLEKNSVLENASMSALLIVDLDEFKSVNDLMGHLFGDAVLTEVSKRLSNTFRASDVIGRIGGDEFIVYMKNIPNRDIALKKAQEACDSLKSIHRLTTEDRPFMIAASIGIAFAPDDGITFNELYNKADIALYSSKDSGKSRFTVYEGAMGTELSRDKKALASIDSRNTEDTFAEAPAQHVFRILFNAKDLRMSIYLVLELVARHFSFMRGFVFENSPDNLYCSETFEWCNDGVEPHIDLFQNCLYSELFPRLPQAFNSEGVLFENQSNTCYGLQVAIMDRGEYRGFLGFDFFDSDTRALSPRDLRELISIGQIIAAFILKYQKLRGKQK